jgi:ribonuclease D
MLIDDDKRFADLVGRCREAGLVAFDTEFIRERRYRPLLCLVQIALPSEATAVDPFAIDDLTPLVDLLADPAVRKVVHAGQQDMEIFFADAPLDQLPRNVFDTQIAAALLGYGDGIGYSRLVGEVLGLRLAKTEQFTDWSRRPLAERQVDYALEDVVHLREVYHRLLAGLEESQRLAWLEEELGVYQKREFYRRDPVTLYERVKGATRLSREELAVLRQLVIWREEEASRADRPRSHIASDEVLVELVKARPTDLERLRSFRWLRPDLVRRHGVEIVRRVQVGLATPPDALPPPRARAESDPSLSLVVDLFEAFLKARAAALRISAGCLASRSELSDLVESRRAQAAPPERVRLARGWRYELVGRDLIGLLEGNYALAIEPEGITVVVEPRGGDREAPSRQPGHQPR